jgi:hypothetical protein
MARRPAPAKRPQCPRGSLFTIVSGFHTLLCCSAALGGRPMDPEGASALGDGSRLWDGAKVGSRFCR